MDVKQALQSAVVKVTSSPDGDGNIVSGVENALPANDLVSAFFQKEHPSQAEVTKMNELYEWAKEQAGEKEEDILNTLRDVRYRLGAPNIGENEIASMHRYITLVRRAKDYETQAKAMER